ncbi:MAG: SusC/RagA family TonB-linked outer membrane protein [Leadbetterella sp.]|nr:SusC/RagA family TonB-linked outer membrane protein [Leadbetterella sp.]
MKKNFYYFFACLAFITLSFSSFAQQKVTLTGTVTDLSGHPIVSASVRIKGENTMTDTKKDGRFTLISSTPIGTIVISFVGYKTQEVDFSGNQDLNIKLEYAEVQLKEVVVNIGYATLNKKEITTSVAHLGPNDLSSVAGNSGPLMSMQGKVAGLSITNVSTADPNAQPSVQLQGISSRQAGLGPLYIVNGVPGASMLNINQNDIESVDVLQGGAASAIYGTRGANGVIIITTKKGSSEPQMFLDSYFSFDYITNKLKVLSHDEFLKHNMGNDYGYNTDWLKAVSNNPALGQKHTIQFSGGSVQTNYITSIDYKTSEGIDLRAKRKEYGGRVNINHQTKNKLFTLNFNAAPRFIYQSNASYNAFNKALTLSPTLPIKDTLDPTRYTNIQTGFLYANNPLDELMLVKSENRIFLLDISGSAKMDITNNLSTTVTLGQSYSNNNGMGFVPSNSISATNYNAATAKGLSSAYQNLNVNNVYNFDWTGNYAFRSQNHSFNLLAGYSYAYFNNRGFNASNADFPSDLLLYNNLGAGLWNLQKDVNGADSYQNDSKLIAFFGRLSYKFRNKYSVTASLRQEGSSKFGDGNKWGYFPGVSAAWRMSKEPFMKNISWINDLKLRADYGIAGNQDFGAYTSLPLYTKYGYYPLYGKLYQGYGPSQTPNRDLTWEKTVSYNVGLDFELLDYRLSGSLNYFIRENKDLLGSYPIPNPPAIIGTITANVGSMKNWGLQLQLNGNVIQNRDFNYNVSFTGYTLGNKFESFSNQIYTGQPYIDMANMSAPGSPGTIQRLQEGRRIGSFYLKRSAGVDSTGAILVYDAAGNIIRGDKSGVNDRQFIGNGLPKFTASLGNNFSYKNWDLSVYFRGAFGYQIFNTFAFYVGTPVQQKNANVLTSAFDPDSKYSKVTNSATYSTLSDYFLENANWVKLDNVSLGYTHHLKNQQYIKSARLYVTGRNLHTFTKYTGGDPEMVNINGLTPGINTGLSYYPSSLQLIFGLQINF